jgi:hypothetical protein
MNEHTATNESLQWLAHQVAWEARMQQLRSSSAGPDNASA